MPMGDIVGDMATQELTAGQRIGKIVFTIVGMWLGIFSVLAFLIVGVVAWQFGTAGTGIVGGLTLALVLVVLTLASYMMARAFNR